MHFSGFGIKYLRKSFRWSDGELVGFVVVHSASFAASASRCRIGGQVVSRYANDDRGKGGNSRSQSERGRFEEWIVDCAAVKEPTAIESSVDVDSLLTVWKLMSRSIDFVVRLTIVRQVDIQIFILNKKFSD